MKVVLANLPWRVKGRSGVRAGSRWPHIKTSQEGDYLPFPFFLAYAASLLKKNDYEVYLIDAIAEDLSYEDFIRKVKKITPHIIVAETSTASLYNDMVLFKRLSKYMKTVACGPDINITKKEFLEANRFIDYVLVGEYEITLLELLDRLKKDELPAGIDGLIYRENGFILKNRERALLEDLNVLPWPMRECLPMERYYDIPGGMPVPSVQMMASRGCPFQCIFCAWPQIMYKKGSYRTRSVKDVVNEMEYLVNCFGFKSIYFDDDTWNIGKQRVLEFSKEVEKKDESGRLGVPWAMMGRADLMDEEQLIALKKVGLYAVKYGVESSNQEILDRAKKSMNLKKAERMIKLTMAMGIKTHLTFTFGLPGETKESVENTIDYALRLNPTSTQFSITTPYPGTDYFLSLDKEGRILTKDWSEYDGNYRGVFSSDKLNAEELVEAKERACAAWESHVRYREPNQDFPVKKLTMKFLNYINSKGFKYALYKTFDYLKFVLKRSSYYQDLNMKKIGKGNLKVGCTLGKIRVFWNNAELTKGVGLNTSVRIYENWFDSSQAEWKIIEKKHNSLKMVNEWKYLPIKQVWHLDIVDEGRIDWKIDNIYLEDLELDSEKAGIMLSQKYNAWVVDGKIGEFKISRNWQEINIKDPYAKKVGAKSLSNPMMPYVELDFSMNGAKSFPQIQSSSRDMNARFIHAYINRHVKYKAGEYEFFKGSIYIKRGEA